LLANLCFLVTEILYVFMLNFRLPNICYFKNNLLNKAENLGFKIVLQIKRLFLSYIFYACGWWWLCEKSRNTLNVLDNEGCSQKIQLWLTVFLYTLGCVPFGRQCKRAGAVDSESLQRCCLKISASKAKELRKFRIALRPLLLGLHMKWAISATNPTNAISSTLFLILSNITSYLTV
jgi:hypothetical protein